MQTEPASFIQWGVGVWHWAFYWKRGPAVVSSCLSSVILSPVCITQCITFLPSLSVVLSANRRAWHLSSQPVRSSCRGGFLRYVRLRHRLCSMENPGEASFQAAHIAVSIFDQRSVEFKSQVTWTRVDWSHCSDDLTEKMRLGDSNDLSWVTFLPLIFIIMKITKNPALPYSTIYHIHGGSTVFFFATAISHSPQVKCHCLADAASPQASRVAMASSGMSVIEAARRGSKV